MKTLTEKDIERLLNGDCSAEESKEIMDALPHYPAMQAFYDSWKPLNAGFSAAALKIPDAAYTQQLVAAMHRQVRRRRAWYDQPPLYFFIITLVLLLGVSFFFGPQSLEQLSGGYVKVPDLTGLDNSLRSLLPWPELELPLIAGVCLVLWMALDRVFRKVLIRRQGNS